MHVEMKVAKGTGREHAKWIPCVPSVWDYEEADGIDSPTSVTFGLEPKGSLTGREILSNACHVLRSKMTRILAGF